MDFMIFDITLDEEDLGMKVLSCVKNPAIDRPFKAHQNQMSLYQSDLKYITGPILIPEQLILRHTPELGYFYIKYSKEVIKEIRDRFFQNSLHKQIDLEHSGEIVPATVVESYILKQAEGDLPEGTLMFSIKPDFEITQEFLNEFTGFSIDAIVNIKPSNMNIKQMMINAKLMDGTLLIMDESTGEVYYASDMRPLPDGSYTLDNGDVIIVDGGVIKKEQIQMDVNQKAEVEQVKIEDFVALQNELTAMKTILENVPNLINDNNKSLIEKIELLQNTVTLQQEELVKIGGEPAVETETNVKNANETIGLLEILQSRAKKIKK